MTTTNLQKVRLNLVGFQPLSALHKSWSGSVKFEGMSLEQLHIDPSVPVDVGIVEFCGFDNSKCNEK